MNHGFPSTYPYAVDKLLTKVEADAAIAGGEKWVPQVGDVIRKKPQHAFSDKLCEITELRDNGFQYRVFGTQDFAECRGYCADFILRSGDKVRLLPFQPWAEHCSRSFNRIATVSGVSMEPLSPLGKSTPMTLMVVLERKDSVNEPCRWPLEAVERVSGTGLGKSVTPWRDDSKDIVEASPESDPPMHPLVRLFVHPFVRRDPMTMLPAERQQYEEMIKRREVKPVSYETESDIKMYNGRISKEISDKRDAALKIGHEITALESKKK